MVNLERALKLKMRRQLVLSDIQEDLGQDPLVLLGSCCAEEETGFTCVPPAIDSADEIVRAAATCRLVYEEVLPVLASRLNRELGINLNVFGYRLILGNWLRNFIEAVHERHTNLEQAFNAFPESYCVNSSSLELTLVQDYSGFQKSLQTASYNRLLLLQIINSANRDRLEGIPPALPEYVEITPEKQAIGDRFFHFLHRLRAMLPKRYVLVCNATLPYFSKFRILHFLLRGWSTFAIDNLKLCLGGRVLIRQSFRETALDLSHSKVDPSFRRIVATLVPQNLPIFFLEALPEITRLAKQIPIKNVAAVYTNFGIHLNTLLKVLLAISDPKLALLCHQHGGRYCIDAIHFPFEYEREVATNVLLWGNDNRGICVPSLKLKSRTTKRVDPAGLLLGLSNFNRYHQRHILKPQGGPYKTSDYYKGTQQLVNVIDPSIPITIRSSTNASGVFWRETNNLSFDDTREPFDQALSRYALYCADHLGTTMLESICLGIPTVIMIDPKLTMYHPDAQETMAGLEQLGIIHHSPASAAAFINERYSTINLWWQSDDVQTSLAALQQGFAQVCLSPEKDLLAFFRSQANQEPAKQPHR